ncbi:hypothetical protein HYH02_002288 [Chlamydomonas schloesseri]|uniref:Uncharacterized protein n=1 Tax=Chlamydomonas schloesseri TaxID=2026947 RepID=A0A835WSR2_9CHLO|nr:hypothetical protein HYH02_002288 [Chlamydomonas schloesseri]|eukprot:KAG2452951.1 hypothetical protein HYH02_002288 [Chlamydomonas schloesseri]
MRNEYKKQATEQATALAAMQTASAEQATALAAMQAASAEQATALAAMQAASAEQATALAAMSTNTGVVLEIAAVNFFSQLGVKGTGAILQSADDVLAFVLSDGVHLAAAKDSAFYRDLREAITAPLMHQDAGVLTAIVVLLKGEGYFKEAAEVEHLLLKGAGISFEPRRTAHTTSQDTSSSTAAADQHTSSSTDAEDQPTSSLQIVRRCLDTVATSAKAKGLGDDILQLFQYCNAKSTQERRELMEVTLFVRCAAATLLGAYTGVLEVDAGAGVGCKVDEGAGALRLRTGETKFSAAAMDAADKQQKALFRVSAWTLDKVLAAVAAAPEASQAKAALSQLPRHFIMDGFCVYAAKPTQQQLQAWQAPSARRAEADATVLGAKGLHSAVLQMQYKNMRYPAL